MKAEVVKKYNLYLQKKWLRQLKAEGSELFEKTDFDLSDIWKRNPKLHCKLSPVV